MIFRDVVADCFVNYVFLAESLHGDVTLHNIVRYDRLTSTGVSFGGDTPGILWFLILLDVVRTVGN